MAFLFRPLTKAVLSASSMSLRSKHSSIKGCVIPGGGKISDEWFEDEDDDEEVGEEERWGSDHLYVSISIHGD